MVLEFNASQYFVTQWAHLFLNGFENARDFSHFNRFEIFWNRIVIRINTFILILFEQFYNIFYCLVIMILEEKFQNCKICNWLRIHWWYWHCDRSARLLFHEALAFCVAHLLSASVPLMELPWKERDQSSFLVYWSTIPFPII